MKLLFTLPLAALSLSCLAQAQEQAPTSVNYDITLGAGSGNTDSSMGRVALDITNAKWVIKPYASYQTLSENNSSVQDDNYFIYSGSGLNYHSSTSVELKGKIWNYGLSGQYKFNPTALLNVSVEGQYKNMEDDGNRSESLFNPIYSSNINRTDNSDFYHGFKSRIYSPTLQQNRLNAQVGFTKQFPASGSTLNVNGSFSRLGNDETLCQTALEGKGLDAFASYQYDLDNVTMHEMLSADYHRRLPHNQVIGGGLRFENRDIDRDELQTIDGQQFGDAFSHSMQVMAAFADYRLSNDLFSVNARLEYAYTDMNGKAENDVIPSFAAIWHMCSRHDLMLRYGMRIIRPEAELLSPTKIRGAFTLDFGNPDLIGIHANNFGLVHTYHTQPVRLTTTLQHILVNDGFNAIWMVKDNMRVSTWGNEGIRRAWSLTPDLEWKIAPSKTTINAMVSVLWDKRVAEAIHMAKEHWGITTQLKVQQVLPYEFRFNLQGDYSEGNTVDLYSHLGRSYSYGADLQKKFLNNITVSVAYSNTSYAETILTQGAYTGVIFRRPNHRHVLNAAVNIKF